MRWLWIVAVFGCRTNDAPDLTGTWVGSATPQSGDHFPGGAAVEGGLSESEAGAYFGQLTFDSDDGPQTFDVGANVPGNLVELEGMDTTDTLEIRLLLNVVGGGDELQGTWTLAEPGCETCDGSGSIGLTRQ